MSLAVRITLLCLFVAGVAVLVAGFVSTRLVLTTAREVSREVLSNQADMLARQPDKASVADVLQQQGISIVTVTGGDISGSDRPAVRAVRDVGVGKSGMSGRLLVEARPGFALVQETERAGVGRQLVRNILFALGIGLLVAAIAGLILGTVLSRPLRRTAGVAHAMSAGRRDLRVPVEGPLEVASVAAAINGLADALQHSESRQRDFLLSVSHELRTPLTAVTGFAESLADGVVVGDDVQRAGRTIQQEAHRLDRLVSDLLDLARLGADDFKLDMASIDLVPLVRDAAEVWHARCHASGVVFRLELPTHPVIVRADPRRLRQVIDGLMENALRVTPAGRPVVLSLGAVLQVRDGGPGLAPEDYPRAFERGVLHSKYQGSRPVGTGVGLALVHGLVTRMGGTITAGPAPEGGAAFTVQVITSPA